MMGHITDLCKPKNKQRFTCNGAKVMYNASLIWGTIGPQRMFQSGQVYNGLVYFFLIGVSYSESHIWFSPTDYLAYCYWHCISAVSPLPQQLDPLHQCANFLQCGW
jgi:hypothetical protein